MELRPFDEVGERRDILGLHHDAGEAVPFCGIPPRPEVIRADVLKDSLCLPRCECGKFPISAALEWTR